MSRTLTPEQTANSTEARTRPVVIVRLAHSGSIERLSCSGSIVFDGELYAAGGINLGSISNGTGATLALSATPARVSEVQSGSWRYGICQIFMIPGVPEDSGEYEAGAGVLLLDGQISQSQFQAGRVNVSARQITLSGNYTPRNLIGEVCSHIDPPGTVLNWQGDITVLESRR
jgi:hypothetical protein